MATHDLRGEYPYSNLSLCWHTGKICPTPEACVKGCLRGTLASDKKTQASEEIWLRPELVRFSTEMERKLRLKDGKKTHWRDQPIEALLKLMMLEIEEFKVADEFFSVEEARKELVDIANFALILHDRLGMIRQDENRHKQAQLNAE